MEDIRRLPHNYILGGMKNQDRTWQFLEVDYHQILRMVYMLSGNFQMWDDTCFWEGLGGGYRFHWGLFTVGPTSNHTTNFFPRKSLPHEDATAPLHSLERAFMHDTLDGRRGVFRARYRGRRRSFMKKTTSRTPMEKKDIATLRIHHGQPIEHTLHPKKRRVFTHCRSKNDIRLVDSCTYPDLLWYLENSHHHASRFQKTDICRTSMSGF